MNVSWDAYVDVVVLGSGVAGLTAATQATRLGLRVLVVTKGAAHDCNTALAQGGIAVAPAQAPLREHEPARIGHGDGDGGGDRAGAPSEERDPADSVRRHVDDTLAAGAGLCDPGSVRSIVGDGPRVVRGLQDTGAVFDTAAGGGLARTREGGHSAYRVVHAGGDATGAEVERALLASAHGHQIPVLEHHVGVEILHDRDGTVAGLLVLDDHSRPGRLRCPAVVLATGGLGQLYQATSNPEVATGDGLALGLRAGAEVADIEFVQFHPTVLYTGPVPCGRRPLVTEAVRGEGAVLVDAAGHRIMTGVHPRGDLAPRDVVAAAITRRMAEAPAGVADHVYLDGTNLTGVDVAARFPTVHAACVAAGIDPAKEPIPVAPAAHFACGGLVTTVEGRTRVRGLYAVGEVARTGLHGANRLASNSLLEGLVLGERAARAVADDLARLGPPRSRVARVAGADPAPLGSAGIASAGAGSGDAGSWEAGFWEAGFWEAGPAGSCGSGRTAPALDRGRLQRGMTRYAGIGRDLHGLRRITSALAEASSRPLDTRRAVEDAALTTVARVLVLAAETRGESRGCHVRVDCPQREDARWRHSLAVRLNDEGVPILADPVALGGAA